MEEIKNKLIEERNKLVSEAEDEEDKITLIEENKFSMRLFCFSILSIFPMSGFIVVAILAASNFIDISSIVNFIPTQLMPVVVSGSSLGIAYAILKKMYFKTKTRLKEITKSTKQIDLLEEEIEHKIKREIAENKIVVIEKVIENIDENSDVSYDYNNKMSIKDIDENIKQLERKLANSFEDLAISSKRQVLADVFFKYIKEKKYSYILDTIIAPFIVAIFFMMYWIAPILMVGGFPSILNFAFPIFLAEVAGTSYYIKKIKDDKKVFNKLNNELKEKALPKKLNYEQDIELGMEELDDIKNIGDIYNKLIQQHELLKIKQTEQFIKENEKTSSIINNLKAKSVETEIQNQSDDKGNNKEDVLFKDYPKLHITEESKKDVLEHPELYENLGVRVKMGKFYTDQEYEQRIKEVLNTPLPGNEEKGPTLVKRRKNK